MVHGLQCLNSSSGVFKGDHCKERLGHHEFKIYWPRQLRNIRTVRCISDEEILMELDGDLTPGISSIDAPVDVLFTSRKRLYVKELNYSEMTVLKSIIGRYYDHMTENSKSFIMHIYCVVRIGDTSKTGMFHRRKEGDFTYIMLSNAIYPRLNHDINHVFLLDGTRNDNLAHELGAKGDGDFTLDQELAMSPKERKTVLETLDLDVNFLKSLNLEDYGILYAITSRGKEALLHLPGAPYGPELDVDTHIERRETLRIRHDIPYGIHATAAQLIPFPYKNYEFPEK
jgi:hypothetical protein